MVKAFLKKYFSNVKTVAILMLIAFVVFGLLGFGIWAIYHYTNAIIGTIVLYLVITILVSFIFTYFTFDKNEYKKKKEEEEDTPHLPFMP